MVGDNKKFWTIVKPLLSNKIMSSEKITLAEGTKILKNEQDLISDSISDPVKRAVVKYRAHPSIIAIKENCTVTTNFNFSFVG